MLVIGKLGPGGAERQLVHLARGLADLDWKVTLAVVTTAALDLEPLHDAGVETAVLGAGRGAARAAALPALVRLARQSDLVHSTLWDGSLWGRLAAIAARRPALVSDHSTERRLQQSSDGSTHERMIALHNRVLDPFTAATVACARAQTPLLESEGVRSIVHIPNGLPLEALRQEAIAGVSRADLGLPDDALIVTHVARFRRLKNQTLTFESVAELRDRLGDVHAVFVGDGPGREELEARGEPWAHFLGRRSDVARILSLSDLAVLPSLAEAMPMSLLEAMAVGTPYVATAVGDVAYVTDRTGGGVCVPPGDREAFVSACERLLADDGLRAGLAAAGRAAVEEFSGERMALRYSALFEAVLEQRPIAEAAA